MSRPALAEMVVVGGGVIGASIAYRLAQAGVDVTLVERRFPGSGISGTSFSWVNSFDKKPPVYHQLNVRGIGEHWALAAELGSLVLDVNGDRLDATFLRDDGTIRDTFTINKSVTNKPPTISITGPAQNTTYTAPASFTIAVDCATSCIGR